MIETDAELTAQQQRAAALLAHGSTVREVCETLSIDKSTLVRWRRRTNFASLVREMSGDAISLGLDSLRAISPRLCDRLSEIALESPDEQVAVRALLGALDRAGMGPSSSVDLTVNEGPSNRAELRVRLEQMVAAEGGEVTWLERLPVGELGEGSGDE